MDGEVVDRLVGDLTLRWLAEWCRGHHLVDGARVRQRKRFTLSNVSNVKIEDPIFADETWSSWQHESESCNFLSKHPLAGNECKSLQD